MNKLEREMLELLHFGREKLGFVAVKAEFEAEGSRLEELIWLVDLCRRAGLKLALKISGAEAIRDLHDAKTVRADYVIAPMIETPFALQKFISAKKKVYFDSADTDAQFLINIETETAVARRDHLIEIASGEIDGIVFGRVDYCSSLSQGRSAINSAETTASVLDVSKLCKLAGLDFVVGGGIDFSSIQELNTIYACHLTRFETRKIVLSPVSLNAEIAEKSLAAAAKFEFLWLRNKINFYRNLSQEDEGRIKLLAQRVKSNELTE